MTSNADEAQPYVGETIQSITRIDKFHYDWFAVTFTDGSILEVKTDEFSSMPSVAFGAMVLGDGHVIKL